MAQNQSHLQVAGRSTLKSCAFVRWGGRIHHYPAPGGPQFLLATVSIDLTNFTYQFIMGRKKPTPTAVVPTGMQNHTNKDGSHRTLITAISFALLAIIGWYIINTNQTLPVATNFTDPISNLSSAFDDFYAASVQPLVRWSILTTSFYASKSC